MLDVPIAYGSCYSRALHDTGIREAIRRGEIRIHPAPLDEQFQPSSLDVRVGRVVVFDQQAQRKYVKTPLELTDRFGKNYPDRKNLPILIPSNCMARIYLHERITLDQHETSVDLRSGRGRIFLKLNSRFLYWNESVLCDPSVEPHVDVWNLNSSPIQLYGHDRFAQIFFHPTTTKGNGAIVNDQAKAGELALQIGNPETIGPYVLFRAGDHVFKPNANGVIDTRIQREDDCEQVSLEKTVVLNFGDCAIVQLHPKIQIPNNLGIHILHRLPPEQESFSTKPNSSFLSFEPNRCNAGWVDPGYIGNVTAHIWANRCGMSIKKGDPVALGLFVLYDTPVERKYGSTTILSTHQHSKGTPR